ncbi:MAG: thioredoxin family protein, partial [Flavitalea sp.]
MNRLIAFLIVCLVFNASPVLLMAGENPKTLKIGAAAPNFKLPGVDGKEYTLASFSNANILVVIFTCNHCPTSQAYEERIKQLVSDYSSKGVQVVAIMPNIADGLELSELGYTELGDSFEDMKLRARDKQYNFPYLYDGKTEETSIAYGPAATPHVFIFDKERKLRYQGRIDDTEKPTKTPHSSDTKNAIEELLRGKDVTVKTTKVFGCSTKWKEKRYLVKESDDEWAKQPVSVENIDDAGVSELMKNSTGKCY